MNCPLITPTASSTPMENSTERDNDFLAEDVQDGLEEIDFRRETKEPTGFINTRFDSVVSFNESTRVFTISPLSGSYRYFIEGHEYAKTGTDQVTIGNVSGLWYIYFVGSVLTASQTRWTFDGGLVFVQTIYWNATSGKNVLQSEERHGLVQDWATHRYLHLTHGMVVEPYKYALENFVLRGDGSLDSHATIGYNNLGRIFDEDVDVLPVNVTTVANQFEQKINPILWAPILYKNGGSGIWDKLTSTQFPIAWTSGQRIAYNSFIGSTWGLTQAAEGYFVNMFVCLTLDYRDPIVILCGKGEYQAVTDTLTESWDKLVIELPDKEILPIMRLIYKTSSSYTNQPKAILFAALPIGSETLDNDRYTVEVNTTGNVGVGKYLDRAGGSSSIDNPFIFPEASFVRYMLLQSQAGTLNTCVVGLFKTTDLVNPALTITLNNQNFVKQSYSQYFAPDDQVAWKIISGSVNKPYLTVWVQTQLG